MSLHRNRVRVASVVFMGLLSGVITWRREDLFRGSGPGQARATALRTRCSYPRCSGRRQVGAVLDREGHGPDMLRRIQRTPSRRAGPGADRGGWTAVSLWEARRLSVVAKQASES